MTSTLRDQSDGALLARQVGQGGADGVPRRTAQTTDLMVPAALDPHVRALADAACRDLGLSPWLVLHRPRLHARIAAQNALMAQVRNEAMRVQGKRPRGRDGRFVR